MGKRAKRILASMAVVLLAWAAVPAGAHEREMVAVRDGVVASGGYVWADGGGIDLGWMWFEVGELPSPKKKGKKGDSGGAGVLVSMTAVAPQECYLDRDPALGRTRVMHGSVVIDGTNGRAVFDGDRLVEVDTSIPLHVHTELWTVNEIGPDGEPVPEEFLCTFDEEVGTDLWLEYFTLYSADYSMEQVVPLEARWEHVEVTSGGRNGKGKGKPATELIYDASFRIDLDGDGTPETPEAAVDVRAELASSRGAQITYYYE